MSRAQAAASPLHPLAFAAIAVASFGGPLALAALYAPAAITDVASSAGFVAVAGAAAFVLPLVIWLRYAREVAGPAGLTGYVEAAAGRRVALVQATVWTVSYLLYVVYTSAYVATELLPAAVPALAPYRTAFVVGLPAAVAAVALGGRRATVAVLAVFAVGQLGLVALLDAVAVRHAAPAGAFAPHGGGLASAGAGVALLFVCGSLPTFLGGELRAPRRTVRRWLPAAFAVTAVGVAAAVLPYAVDPAFATARVPGLALVRADVGPAAGTAVGVGVAASVVGVLLVEYVALSRLLHAVTARPVPVVLRWLAVPLVAAGPVMAIDPERFYADLLRPSLVTLWLAQLVVVAGYPRFVAMRRRLRLTDLALSAGASALVLYGLWTSVTAGAGT